ncbi:hypothetical protein LEP1GSC060_2794 [Leptospira weilii serovar Ranarum str. ICFT]|uniref:Uncharacterized protein n=1 Tax=Leptospira weilii serovar Ranarum str. ICFT TaxID=1218598 RepID=N1WMP8_9LEPT|nr:hypothetical protein LEP1GSC060_2794 [Leptospira weilii serovar Ranarum str. ICFT]
MRKVPIFRKIRFFFECISKNVSNEYRIAVEIYYPTFFKNEKSDFETKSNRLF